MFLILIHYTQALDVIDKHLANHRQFLEEGYQKDYFVVSGPREPRSGGIIISQLKDRATLEKIISEDPFYLARVAEYEIVEFNPVKYHKDFIPFL